MKHYLCILAIVLLISGCVSFKGNSGGVIILDFKPEISEVYSGEDVTFMLRIKNVGDVEAKNVYAELLGLKEELSPNEEECKKGKGNVLLPSKEGIEGEEQICTWKYKVREKGLGIEYRPKVKVFYNYKTILVQGVNIMERKEMINLKNMGKTLPASPISKTRSPVDISINMETPIIVYKDSVEVPFSIKIRNIGNGLVCLDSESCNEEEWNKLKLTIDVDDGMALKNCESSMEVKIRYTKEQTVTCKLIVSNVKGIVQKKIRVVAEYGYVIEGETYIRVLGER